jgi:DNA (cytosine-5)-methyltransferase 1
MNAPLTAVSLFAGIGGFDLALHQAGITVTAAVEIDPACRAVLARHFPQTILFPDVSEVTGDQLRATGFVPRDGVLAAGWPCQGNSVAGRRHGMADPRSGLWRHVVRILAEARPRWFLGENVPGLLGINGGADFTAVISDLDDLGYGVAWRVLDAQWFGVPQRRRRVFLAGCLGDGAAPVEVLLEPESGGWNPAPRLEARPDAARRADRSTRRAGGHGTRRVAPTLTSGGNATGGTRAPGTNPDSAESLIVSTLQGGGQRGHRLDAESAAGGHLLPVPLAVRGRDGGSQAEFGAPGDLAFTVRTPAGGSSYPMVATMAFNPQTGGSKPHLGYGVTPSALHASQVPGVHAGTAVRRLTPRECERLQGFPDDWTAGQSDAARYRQLGNAIAVPVAAWIAARLAEACAAEVAA